jgi:alpha/beta superfamily hydrolase
MSDSESVVVPSDRDVRATLDRSDAEGAAGDDAEGAAGDDADGARGADACVVACPPHPQMGGNRRDARLRAVADELDCDCLRIDYGAWDEGRGELADVRDAYAWAREEYDQVGLFGYSFGGCLALVAAARESEAGRPPFAAAALAPAARLSDGVDAVAAVEAIDAPVGVVYGERDTTVDAAAVAERVRERGGSVEVVSADHFFVGQTSDVAERIARMLSR